MVVIGGHGTLQNWPLDGQEHTAERSPIGVSEDHQSTGHGQFSKGVCVVHGKSGFEFGADVKSFLGEAGEAKGISTEWNLASLGFVGDGDNPGITFGSGFRSQTSRVAGGDDVLDWGRVEGGGGVSFKLAPETKDVGFIAKRESLA